VTPAEEAVLAAARAYHAAVSAAKQVRDTEGTMYPPALHEALVARDRAECDLFKAAIEMAAEALVDAPPVEAPTVAAVRPWPDPEAYRALAREVFGEVDLPRDVPSAVAAWKALQDGQRVMCARGYQWTAHRYNGNLMFTQAKQDGRPGKTLEQP